MVRPVVVYREQVGELPLNARRVGPVRMRGGERGVVLAVGEIGEREAEEAAYEDVMPVVWMRRLAKYCI